MQNEEMMSQYKTAGYISPAGYEKLMETEKKLKKELMEQAEHDLIGALYRLPDYLDVDGRTESLEERRIFVSLENYLKDTKCPFEVENRVTESMNEYGIAAEESGFRKGFKVAMKLCMQGMMGGVY